MFGSGLRGDPASPCWGLGWVCLTTGLGFAPPFLAEVCGLCGWAWVLACTPPFLAGVLGRAWLCARSACTPPLLARVCSEGVCAWGRVTAALRHSWLGCSGVCVFVCVVRLYPATPGWGVRCYSVCLGSGFGCAPPHLAGVLGCVCVCVRAPLLPCHSWQGCAALVCVFGLGFRLRSATPGSGVGVCVCLCACSVSAPPLLAGVCGVGLGAGARHSAVPRHSWLGCCCGSVFVCALRMCPATPGLGVGLCVCLCARSARTPSLLAGVCDVSMSVWAPVSACSPPFLAGVLGCVCLCVRATLDPLPLLAGVCGAGLCAWAQVSAAPRHSWLRCWVACVVLCVLRLYPTTPG